MPNKSKAETAPDISAIRALLATHKKSLSELAAQRVQLGKSEDALRAFLSNYDLELTFDEPLRRFVEHAQRIGSSAELGALWEAFQATEKEFIAADRSTADARAALETALRFAVNSHRAALAAARDRAIEKILPDIQKHFRSEEDARLIAGIFPKPESLSDRVQSCTLLAGADFARRAIEELETPI